MSSFTSMRWYLLKLKKYLPKFLQSAKRPSRRQLERRRKKDENQPQATALLMAYSGKNYHGLNFNWDGPTIEGEILKALHNVGMGPPLEYKIQHKVGLQRISRTDKGVSAIGNIVLVKIGYRGSVASCLLRSNVPKRAKENVMSDRFVISPIKPKNFVRTPRDFVDHKACKQRTYSYTVPTFAFAPLEETVTLEYRTNVDVIERVNEVLEKFWYSHSFHNFTMHRETLVKSPRRVIHEFECGLPFVRDGVEFCVIRIRGESFMMHQIRKMIGLTIAIVKGYCDIETIQLCYDEIKVDIPKAPGLGLMLEKLHFLQFDDLFGGYHIKKERKSAIQAKLEDFKENTIRAEIIKTEIEELSMMRWLNILLLHSYAPTRLDGKDRYRYKWLYRALKEIRKVKDDGEETDQEGERSGAKTSLDDETNDLSDSDKLVDDIVVNEFEVDTEMKEMHEEKTNLVDDNTRQEIDAPTDRSGCTQSHDIEMQMKHRKESTG